MIRNYNNIIDVNKIDKANLKESTVKSRNCCKQHNL